jgi:hypothetical protein
MTKDILTVEFPSDIEARIHKIALKTESSDEEVKVRLMRAFFDLVDDSDEKDMPMLVEKVRSALKEASAAG